MADGLVTVVLPCLNEAEPLPFVLAAMPAGYQPLVVDNNSTDDTADVARRLGATVVAEPRPGYGSAVHAGVVDSAQELLSRPLDSSRRLLSRSQAAALPSRSRPVRGSASA